MTDIQTIRGQLEDKKQELSARLDRIKANVRRGIESDSKEAAKTLEDAEVVDALGNEARTEIAKIDAALARIGSGEFGICVKCSEPIDAARLDAYPYADECIDCARFDEQHVGHS